MFDLFYNLQASNLTEPPKLPRYRKVPKRLDGGERPHCYPDPKDRYRHIYYETLELVSGEIERRFNQSDLNTVKDLEELLLTAANGELGQEYQIPEALSSYLEGDIDQIRLKVHLSMIPDMIKTAFDRSIKKVTTVRTLTAAMNKSEVYKGMLSEVDKLLQIYFTFPVTSAFSSLRRIKTFLRSSMTHCRLLCYMFTLM